MKPISAMFLILLLVLLFEEAASSNRNQKLMDFLAKVREKEGSSINDSRPLYLLLSEASNITQVTKLHNIFCLFLKFKLKNNNNN